MAKQMVTLQSETPAWFLDRNEGLQPVDILSANTEVENLGVMGVFPDYFIENGLPVENLTKVLFNGQQYYVPKTHLES